MRHGSFSFSPWICLYMFPLEERSGWVFSRRKRNIHKGGVKYQGKSFKMLLSLLSFFPLHDTTLPSSVSFIVSLHSLPPPSYFFSISPHQIMVVPFPSSFFPSFLRFIECKWVNMRTYSRRKACRCMNSSSICWSLFWCNDSKNRLFCHFAPNISHCKCRMRWNRASCREKVKNKTISLWPWGKWLLLCTEK